MKTAMITSLRKVDLPVTITTTCESILIKICHTGREDDALMKWPPQSPDLTPCNFFLWGFVKDTVYVPLLTADIQELQHWITAAVALVNSDILDRVWGEMDLAHGCMPY